MLPGFSNLSQCYLVTLQEAEAFGALFRNRFIMNPPGSSQDQPSRILNRRSPHRRSGRRTGSGTCPDPGEAQAMALQRLHSRPNFRSERVEALIYLRTNPTYPHLLRNRNRIPGLRRIPILRSSRRAIR